MKKYFLVAAATFSLASAQAALVGRDISGNAVAGNDANSVFLYDTVLDITWLRDANAEGSIQWAQANAWAANLVVGAYDDWRLPTMIANPDATFGFTGTDRGYNVRTTSGSTVYSEMASLIYDTLGNLAFYSTSGTPAQLGWGLTNAGDFQNLKQSFYWIGLEYAPNPSDAWSFNPAGGNQENNSKTNAQFALAVRSGDVAPAVVPIPAALPLLLSGLAALGVASRRRGRGRLGASVS